MALLGVVFVSCADYGRRPEEIRALKVGNRAWLHLAEFHPDGRVVLFTNELGLAVGVAQPKGEAFTGSWIRTINSSPELNAEFSIVSGRFVAGAALGFPLSGGLKTNMGVHICLGKPSETAAASVHVNIIVSNYSTGAESVLELVDLNCDFEWDIKATNSSKVLRVGDRWLPVVRVVHKRYLCLEDGQTNLFRWNGRWFERVQAEERTPLEDREPAGFSPQRQPSRHGSKFRHMVGSGLELVNSHAAGHRGLEPITLLSQMLQLKSPNLA